MSKISQEDFLEEFAQLIKVFSKLVPSPEGNLDDIKKLDELISRVIKNSLSNILGSHPSNAKKERPYNEDETKNTFDRFMNCFYEVEFNHGILPYDKITECVFKNTPEEILDEFTISLRSLGSEYFSEKSNPDKEKDFFRIMRHIDLALVQKYNFIEMKLKNIEETADNVKVLMTELHNLKKDYTNLKKDYTELKEKAEEQNKTMLGQFISILGIFSAVLMGSFGAIQGFTSLFNNAYLLSMGEMLIISSIGGASVILILFFLLTSIAKMIGKNLKNTDKPDATTVEKYSTLFVIYGILGLISMVGAALLLSNIKVSFSWSGFWWLLPIIWCIYFIYCFRKKTLFPFFNSKKTEQ